MDDGRLVHPLLDLEKVAHEAHLAKRHARLSHAPGPGVHPEEKRVDTLRGIAVQIRFMRPAGVDQRVVDARGRPPELEPSDLPCQPA